MEPTPGRVSDAVCEIIVKHFREEFEQIFQVTFDVTGEQLIQANNGIRNALNHLGTALVVKDEAEAELELKRAIKHIYFAKYDGLMVAIVDQLNFLTKYVEATKDIYPDDFALLSKRLVDVKLAHKSVPRLK